MDLLLLDISYVNQRHLEYRMSDHEFGGLSLTVFMKVQYYTRCRSVQSPKKHGRLIPPATIYTSCPPSSYVAYLLVALLARSAPDGDGLGLFQISMSTFRSSSISTTCRYAVVPLPWVYILPWLTLAFCTVLPVRYGVLRYACYKDKLVKFTAPHLT